MNQTLVLFSAMQTGYKNVLDLMQTLRNKGKKGTDRSERVLVYWHIGIKRQQKKGKGHFYVRGCGVSVVRHSLFAEQPAVRTEHVC
jgi:hypothetical protein